MPNGIKFFARKVSHFSIANRRTYQPSLANRLGPFQSWIIAVSVFPQEGKALAQEVFGSNLVLDCKKARGSCVNPWSLLVEKPSSGGVVRARGLESS
jgi:hypothetical protein